jgi:flagellar motor switch protein FliM
MEKVLNQEEIDAMVQAARSGAAPSEQRRGPVVAAWDPRLAGQIGKEQMRAINLLHEAFARNLTHSLGAYLRVPFEVNLVSAENLAYREFLLRLPEITYLAFCRLKPVDVSAVMQLDLSVAFPMVDVLLGGEGKGAVPSREVTDIEEQILESVMRIVCRELEGAWQAISLEFQFEQRQSAAVVQRLMPREEKTLCLSFEVTLSEVHGTLSLAVPAVVSNALLRKISASWVYQKPRGPVGSQEQLRARLLGCPLPLDLRVTGARIRVRELADLVPGKLLTFARHTDAPAMLRVGGKEMFGAAVVRCGKVRAARLLERISKPADGKDKP